VPTPFDDDFQVDFGKMATLTKFLVESGLVTGTAVLKVAAAMGEGPQLRDNEWAPLLRTVVQAAQDKAVIACGIQYKDTVRAIEDARRAQDLGAVALQIAPPIFNDPTQDDILRYFEAISEAIDIGIIIYNSPWWPNGNILPETFLKMKDFEHVVAIKWSVPQGQDYNDMRDLVPIFNILDNSDQPVRCHKLGGQGYISDTADAYPPFDLKVWELMESHRYDEAQAFYDAVVKRLRGEFERKLYPISGGQARLKKGLLAAMGHPVGVSRPPSLPLSEEEMAALRELLLSFGWPVPAQS
jgi:4-hydroxy-tetrahydrodipicolinate synthase